MKKSILLFATLALISLGGGIVKSATINWTNTLGGDWNDTNNWDAHHVPASGDNVAITNAGTYTVTNASGVTLASLILGGTNGIQTLSIASLTLTNASMVNSNGVLNWSGGDLESSLTVAPGGTLSISNSVVFAQNNYNYGYTNMVALTNYGTVAWAATIYVAANNTATPGGGMIYNAGLWQALADNSMSIYAGSPTNLFINTGTLQKTGGTGTSTIGWNFSSTGTINTLVGLFALNWNGPSTLHGNLTLSETITAPLTISSGATLNWVGGDLSGGWLTIAPGGTLTVSNSVSFGYNGGSYSSIPNGGFLTNNGTVIWAANNGYGYGGGSTIYNAGLWQDEGDDNLSTQFGTNTFINAGTFQKIGGGNTSTIGWDYYNSDGTLNTPSGLFNFGNWLGNGAVHGNATFSGTASGIIASNAVMNWSGGDWSGRSVTVAQGGTLTISNTVSFGYNGGSYSSIPNGGFLTNNGTVIWAANNIYGYGVSTFYNAGLWQLTTDGNLSTQFGTNSFINAGTLRKINSGGTSTLGWNFSDAGTVDIQTGNISVPNLFVQTAGLTLLDGGNLQVPAGFVLQGGTLGGTNTVFGNVTNSGVVAPGLSPGKLTINGSYTQITNGTLSIELAGTDAGTNFDLLVVNGFPGTATLAGNLKVALTNGFYPLPNATFTFLNAGSVGSTFDNFNYPSNDVGMTVNYAAANTTVQVINVHPVLPVLGSQTLNEQTLLTVNAAATDADTPPQTLTYSLTNSPSGASVNSSGVISWTPGEDQGPAVTNITVIVKDNGTPNLAVSTTFQVTVNEVNVAPVPTGPSDQTVNEQTQLNIFATATDSDIPANPLTFALVSGPSGLNVAANGNITWTPDESQGPGVYTVFVKVSDFNAAAVNATSLSATNSFQITVNEVNTAPVLGTLNNFTVNAGQTVSFTATATDSDIPANTLTFNLVSPPTGATISGSGLFNWRVPTSFANSINAVQVRVTDNGSPNLSDTKSFNVTVNPLASVVLTPVNYTNSQFKVQVSGTTGPDYIIVGSSNLLQWSDLFTNFSPATPFQFTDTNNNSLTKRFYRVRLAP